MWFLSIFPVQKPQGAPPKNAAVEEAQGAHVGHLPLTA